MRRWLMKSEPDEVSIDDLAATPRRDLPWFGVRNYQARNYMRDDMQAGDLALFYHSSCLRPGPHPEPTVQVGCLTRITSGS